MPRTTPPVPRRRRARSALLGTLLWTGVALAPGCGADRAPGGGGTLTEGSEGAPRVLHLRGSAYQMGWWHGHRLKARIRALLPAWRDALFIETVGVPYAERQHAAARALRDTIEFYVDQCQHRMSERLKQEYDGLSAGCGVPVIELIELEVLRDVLRTKGMAARLRGSMAATMDGSTLRARAWWSGTDASTWAQHLLVIRRTPENGGDHTVLTWPGSLGAMAGMRPDGMAMISAEVDLTDEHRRGFSGGLPFALVVRNALEHATSYRALAGLAGSAGTMGHVVLSAHGRTGEVVGSLEASASGYEVPQFLADTRFLAIGPYERLPGPRANALRRATNVPGLSLDERFAIVGRHADTNPKSEPTGPTLELAWAPGGVRLTVRRRPDGIARSLSYRFGPAEGDAATKDAPK